MHYGLASRGRKIGVAVLIVYSRQAEPTYNYVQLQLYRGGIYNTSYESELKVIPFAINPCIFREILMPQRSSRNYSIATDPGATAGTPPDDQLPADGKDLGDEVLTSSEVSVSPGYDNTLDISVNLQSLVELPSDFC